MSAYVGYDRKDFPIEKDPASRPSSVYISKVCGYRSEQRAQLANHFRWGHTRICLACPTPGCTHRFWASKGYNAHVKKCSPEFYLKEATADEKASISEMLSELGFEEGEPADDVSEASVSSIVVKKEGLPE